MCVLDNYDDIEIDDGKASQHLNHSLGLLYGYLAINLSIGYEIRRDGANMREERRALNLTLDSLQAYSIPI